MRPYPPADRGPRQGLFAARQVYLRNGTTSRYVNLSRALQIAVTTGAGLLSLWLGTASYLAVAKHLETIEQGRELARLEGVAKALRSAVEEAQQQRQPEGGAETDRRLMTELAEARRARNRAAMLAEAAAGEAETLRREVTLAGERIGELELALVRAQLDRQPRTSLIGGALGMANGALGIGNGTLGLGNGALGVDSGALGPSVAAAGGPATLACATPWTDARR